MTTVEDKMKLFSKIIYEKIDEENQKEIELFEKEKALKLEELKKYLDSRRASLHSDTLKRAQMKASEILTKEKINTKQEVLSFKEKLINETISSIEEEFVKFIDTIEYKDLLMRIILQCLTGLTPGKYVLYITEKDYQKYSHDIEGLFTKVSHCNVSILQTSSHLIGGFVVEDSAGKYRIDNSFTSKIKDSKAKIGLMVMNKLG